MPTRLLNQSDSESWLTLASYVNDVTDGLFWPAMVFVLWAVSFMVSLRLGLTRARAWTAATFLGAVLAIPFAITGLVPPITVALFGVLLAAGVAWMRLENATGQV